MPDPTLHGNGEPCPACALRREAMDQGAIIRPDTPCNVCAGSGRLGYATAYIVALTVAEARRIHWPAFEARIAAQEPSR